MTTARRRLAALGVLAMGSVLTLPEIARACGGRVSSGTSSSGSSSSGRSGSSSGGYSGSPSSGYGSGAPFGSYSAAPSGQPRTPCAPSRPVDLRVAPDVAAAFRAMGAGLELSGGMTWQSIEASTLQWSGWSSHPFLDEQMGNATSAPGSALGLNRITMLGGTMRLTALFADMFTVAVSGSLLQQSDGNATVDGARGRFGAQQARGVEGGGELGGLARLGIFTLRAGVFVGYRRLWADVGGLGFAGCETVPVVSTERVFVAPRLQLNASVSRNVTLGVYLGVDALRPADHHGGVMLAVHGGSFAEATPELTAR